MLSFYLLFDLSSWSARPHPTRLWMFSLKSIGDENIRNLDEGVVAFALSVPAAAAYSGAVYVLIGGWLGVVVGVVALGTRCCCQSAQWSR